MKNYRIVNVGSREVLSLDPIDSIDAAHEMADDIESHETQPETEIQENIDGEWVKVN